MRYLVLAALVAAFLASTVGTARAEISPSFMMADTNIVESTETVAVNELDPDAGLAPIVDPATGLVYPSGCRQVDIAAVVKSAIFHTVIYKFHQIKHWCWHRGFVYDERHAWSFEGGATACFDAVYPPNAWFFAWHGNTQGGHYSEERAHVTNCVFRIGSWRELYPDVKIWAHADGSYDNSTQN